MTARQSIHITSTEGSITLTSPKELSIKVAGSELKINEAGVFITTPHTFRVKSEEKEMAGGERVAINIPVLPVTKTSPSDLLLEYLHADGTPIYGAKYTVTFSDGSQATGFLNEKGQALIRNAPEGDATVQYELATQK